jgi:hypothetical protein
MWVSNEDRLPRERSRTRGILQPLTQCVIRVFDEAGNVIESTSTRAILKSGECLLLKLDVRGFFAQSDQGL